MRRYTWFQVVMVILPVMLLSLATGCETIKPSECLETSALLTYSDTNNGFSISYPRDWELVPKDLLSDKDIVGFWIPEAENKGKPIFSMSKQECPTDTNPDNYFQTLKVVLQGSPAYDYQFISKDDLTIDGSAAIRHTFAYMRGEERLKAMQIYLVKSGSAWIMTCLCSPEFFDSFKPAFDTMSNSLRIF